MRRNGNCAWKVLCYDDSEMLKAAVITTIIGLLLGRLKPLPMLVLLAPMVAAQAVYLRYHALFSDSMAVTAFVGLIFLGEAAYVTGLALQRSR